MATLKDYLHSKIDSVCLRYPRNFILTEVVDEGVSYFDLEIADDLGSWEKAHFVTLEITDSVIQMV